METIRIHIGTVNPQEAATYLDAVLETGDKDAFLLALRDVAEARLGGMSEPTQQSGLFEPWNTLPHVISQGQSGTLQFGHVAACRVVAAFCSGRSRSEC